MGFFLVIVALLRPSVGQLRPFGLTPDGRPKRLRIHNACGSEPVWIAHLAGNGTGPDLQNVKIEPNAMWDFVTSTNLSSTRYWPKYRCDQHGNHCLIGESGGVGQECDQEGCAPPVDTKFEATFGDNAHLCDFATQKGCDWVDVSLVDGFTAPFQLSIEGTCYNGSGALVEDDRMHIDCMGLTLYDCPPFEELATQWVDLRATQRGKVLGCYSPCSKLTLRQWNNEIAEGRSPTDHDLLPYCCPTPPVTPKKCRKGPVRDTQYVQTLKARCPAVYGFAYDDGMGLLRCEASTRYLFTVGCPSAPDYEFPDGLFAKRKLWNLPPLPSVTVKGCEIGSAAICPDGGRCDAQTPCCSDGSLCPSWGWMEDPAAGCPHPKKLNCVKGLTKARTLDMCHVGDFVPCPATAYPSQAGAMASPGTRSGTSQDLGDPMAEEDALYQAHREELLEMLKGGQAKLQPRSEGGVGLLNQGATCYMNSLLQSLFNIPEFRVAVYQFEHDAELHGEPSRCIPLQLQRLFAELQLSQASACSTKELTAACGFSGRDAMEQHDVQELCRVLFDALERSSSLLSEVIRDLYSGQMTNYTRCKEDRDKVYESRRPASYMDLQVPIQDCKTLEEALRNFTEPTLLSGDNQWLCEELGEKVDALSGTSIDTVPKILCLQLLRFVFDLQTMRRKKLSDLLAIPLELDLSFWGGGTYELSAVCLHSGTAHGGHYHAFLRDPEGVWKDANDQRVQILGARQCETLFPKSDDGRSVLHSSDAYFLLYRKCGMNADWSAQEVPVPERLSAPILEENQRLLQLQRVYRLHRKLTEVKVFAPKAVQLLLQRFAAQQLQGLCEIPDSVELSVSFTTLDPRPATIRQKALKALARVDAEWVKTLNLPACEAARLRHFDTLRGIAQKPLEDTFSGGLVHLVPDVGVEAILGDLVLLVHWDQAQPTLSVEQVAAFQLQVKQDAVGERKDLEPEEEPTLTSNPDEVPDLFAEMPRCPDEEPGERRAASTLGELRASAAQRWRLPREATVLVALTGMQAGHELLDDMATLQQCGLSPDDVVCVELRPEKGDPRAKKLYEEKRNTSRMFFNHPDRPEISEEFPAVALSKDSSLAELKARIAGVLGISSDLHLSKSQHAPAMFKDETRTLRQAGFQEIDYVFVGHGAPCGPDESMLKVSRYTYENGNHKVSDGFTFPARGDMSVRSFKEALVKVCADWEEEKLPVTWKRLRLRDGQAGKHFAILRDQRTLRSALLGFADGRQVAVQLMPEEEELGPEDMVILVRPWRVMDNRLHAATEVMVSRNQTLAHFQEKMTERFKGLLLDDEDKENHPQDPSECQDMLEICAAHSAGPPMTVKRCETLKWAESRLSERGNPKPLADFKELRDGVTVILRSQRAARHGPAAAQETGKSTGKGPGKPGAKAKAPAQGQKGGAKGPSVTVAAPARERGLVIKVAHPEAEESTM